MSHPKTDEIYPKRLAPIFYVAPRLALAFEPCLDLEKNCSAMLQADEQRFLEKDGAVELVGLVFLAGVRHHPDVWKDGSIENPNDGLSDISAEWLRVDQSRLTHKGRSLAHAVSQGWPDLMTPDRITFAPLGESLRVPMWPNSVFIFASCLTHAAYMLRQQPDKPTSSAVPVHRKRPVARTRK